MTWAITNRAISPAGQPTGDLGEVRYLADNHWTDRRTFAHHLERAIAERRQVGVEVPAVVFFAHGYNTTWGEAVGSAAAVERHFDGHPRQPLVVLCSWPSEGNALAYAADLGEIGAASLGLVEALGAAVNIAVERAPTGQCPTQLMLIGHSMGCQVLAHVARGLWRNLGRPSAAPVFAETILMGADLDNNALEVGAIGEGLVRLSRRLAVYRNHADHVLGLSSAKRVGLTGPRLGREGVPRRDRLPSPETVVELDVTEAVAPDARGGGHSCYLYDEAAIRQDLREVVAGTSKGLVAGRRPIRDGVYALTREAASGGA